MPRIGDAQVHPWPLQHQPVGFRTARARRYPAKIEAHHNALLGQAVDGNAAAHVPDQESRIQTLAFGTHRPALAPLAEPDDDLAQLLARGRQAVIAPAPVGPGGARDDVSGLELA